MATLRKCLRCNLQKERARFLPRYCIYINIEVYNLVQTIKYIYKYIYKDSDCTTI